MVRFSLRGIPSLLSIPVIRLTRSSGQIHRNYNRWIQNLNQGIQTRLAVQAVK
jgi:hypothetical protein